MVELWYPKPHFYGYVVFPNPNGSYPFFGTDRSSEYSHHSLGRFDRQSLDTIWDKTDHEDYIAYEVSLYSDNLGMWQ